MFKDWGYNKLGEKEHEESIDEMKHADKIIERVLFLDGIPNVQDMHKIMIGEEPVECLSCDLKLEEKEKFIESELRRLHVEIPRRNKKYANRIAALKKSNYIKL